MLGSTPGEHSQIITPVRQSPAVTIPPGFPFQNTKLAGIIKVVKDEVELGFHGRSSLSKIVIDR